MVLAEHSDRYFEEAQQSTYFMLFNCQVKEDANIPAVTHMDGSARVQHVVPECGLIHSVLDNFHKLTGSSVIMNTSFNGPGEPVVELPEQALDFLLRTEIDALFFPGYKVTRRD